MMLQQKKNPYLAFFKVVVFDQVSKIVYVSDDEGESYKMNTVPFKPYDVMCIGSKQDNLLLAYDEDTQKVTIYTKKTDQLIRSLERHQWVASSAVNSFL